ncbi:MAG: hypothetical protein ABJF10_06960 [Chthoniobacter sp.]|uniref:hypothetical protein n=1 Tax=Chthoniobacter sp. TaxID=2510640 RepID=UPI0032AB47EE
MTPPTETAGPPNGFKDRKTGLVVFGVLTALLGGLCALLVPLMYFGQAMAPQGTPQQNTQMLLPAALMYAALAAVLVWLGIGSMMARRWARALLLIFSWSWLIMGVISLGFLAFILPQAMAMAQPHPAGQPEATSVATWVPLVIIFIMITVIYVIMPGAWVLFYRSKHVKATCEAYDPVERWTDRSPLPVIAISIWLAFSAPMMLFVAVAYHGAIPVFGMFVTGPVGSGLYVLLALVFGYCARALYKLETRGWWIVLIAMGIFTLSAFTTYLRHDVSELYALAGYSEQQVAMMQKMTFLKGQTMAWFTLAASLPFLGYLIYLRRYFPRPAVS